MPNRPMKLWSAQMRVTANFHAKAQRLAHRDLRLTHPAEYLSIKAGLRAATPGKKGDWYASRALNEMARRHHDLYLTRRHHHLAALREQAAQQRAGGR